jgi:CRP/FNR family transcriptional regulator
MICDLPADLLEEFQALATTAVYRPRQVLFHEGGPSPGLYLICRGAVKLYCSDRFGRDHILEIAAPGTMLGELPLDPHDTMSVSAEVVSDASICFLPRERFLDFLQRHPPTALRLIALLSKQLASARRQVRDLALKGAESRLASRLLQLAQAGDPGPGARRIHLPYTRRELAEMIGVATETAIRLLAGLRRQGVLEIQGREVVIVDLDRLARLASYDETSPS